MIIEYDHAKSERNDAERGLPFHRVVELDWETALTTEDDRAVYPERRYVSLAYLDDRLHVVCFTPIPYGIRVISFRKANVREVRRFENR